MSQNIHLHIDRIVLDGIDIPPSQHDRLKAMIETELTRLFWDRTLFGHQSLAPSLIHQTMPKLSIEVRLTPRSDLLSIGQQISQIIYKHVCA